VSIPYCCGPQARAPIRPCAQSSDLSSEALAKADPTSDLRPLAQSDSIPPEPTNKRMIFLKTHALPAPSTLDPPPTVFLECGDMSPLSDWQTCLPVPKRGRARALQIGPSAPFAGARTLGRFNVTLPSAFENSKPAAFCTLKRPEGRAPARRSRLDCQLSTPYPLNYVNCGYQT